MKVLTWSTAHGLPAYRPQAPELDHSAQLA